MSVQASLSKQDIQYAAYLASQQVDYKNLIWRENVFIQTLGDVIRDHFKSVRLIGEIERREGQETYDVLRLSLQDALYSTTLRQICQNGTASWRAAFSLYFVWTGIYCYGEESGHDLWPAVFKGLGLNYSGNISWLCGQLFMECLEENKLEDFAFISVGQPYITRILLHGLIPQ